MGAENEAEQAALKIQAIRRGSRARGEYKDTRDEEARRQWVEYYVQTGNYAEARELGWDDGDANAPGTPGSASDPPAPVARAESDVTTGPIAITDDDEREKAARLMQAHMRGSSARLQYRDKRDDEARSQWISYYLALGDLESARELGWDEADEEQAKAATALAKVRRGQLARRSLAGSVAIPGAMPFPDLPKPSNVDDEAAPAEEQAAAPAAEEAAPATPERLPNLTAAEREAFVEAEREAFGGKTENEMALEAAQEGAPIFSARWFGKVWDGMLSPDKGKGGAEGGDPETAEETEEARRAKQMEEKAAILVQCWCRVVLAKVAVKNEGRKYRLLALYAHVEEKNANKIQAAFRNRRPSAVATGESAGSASEDVASASYAANYETKARRAPLVVVVVVVVHSRPRQPAAGPSCRAPRRAPRRAPCCAPSAVPSAAHTQARPLTPHPRGMLRQTQRQTQPQMQSQMRPSVPSPSRLSSLATMTHPRPRTATSPSHPSSHPPSLPPKPLNSSPSLPPHKPLAPGLAPHSQLAPHPKLPTRKQLAPAPHPKSAPSAPTRRPRQAAPRRPRACRRRRRRSQRPPRASLASSAVREVPISSGRSPRSRPTTRPRSCRSCTAMRARGRSARAYRRATHYRPCTPARTP